VPDRRRSSSLRGRASGRRDCAARVERDAYGDGLAIAASFDLVLATIGRTDEPARFLESLSIQSHRRFRLIVADQNADERVVCLIREYEDAFPIVWLSTERGLSRARNAALEHLSADIVAFPDDDCSYPPDVLERVAAFLSEHREWDGLCGRAVDERGRLAAGQRDLAAGAITLFNLWRRVASYTVFLRRDVISAVGGFDEAMGVGAGTPWGSGEDLDYVARAVKNGSWLHYDPTLTIEHPQKREQSPHPDAAEGYAYGAGFGRALRRNRLPWWFFTYSLLRSSVAAAMSVVIGNVARARFHIAVTRGRARGWSDRTAS
jgi:glycosyltransferase involved in cell wall biosynthesis